MFSSQFALFWEYGITAQTVNLPTNWLQCHFLQKADFSPDFLISLFNPGSNILYLKLETWKRKPELKYFLKIWRKLMFFLNQRTLYFLKCLQSVCYLCPCTPKLSWFWDFFVLHYLHLFRAKQASVKISYTNSFLLMVFPFSCHLILHVWEKFETAIQDLSSFQSLLKSFLVLLPLIWGKYLRWETSLLMYLM